MKLTPFCSLCLTALLFSHLYAQNTLEPLTVTGSNSESDFNTDDLELLQITKTSHLLGQAPGFSNIASGAAGYGDFIGVRGTGNTSFFGPAGVAMMVDDVPYSDAFTYSTDFFDLSSLDLHRGPQGAYFGRNGAGGLLEYRTLGLNDEASNQYSISGGDYNSIGLRLRYGKRESDTLGYTFQTYFNERDGFINNPLTGQDLDSRKALGFLGTLQLNPAADTEMRLRFMMERVRDGAARLSPLAVNPAYAGSPYSATSDLAGQNELDRYQFSFHHDRDFGGVDFQSITSFQFWELGPQSVDLDFSPFPIASSTIDQDQNYFTQEFRLRSEEGLVAWNTGAFFSYKDGSGSAIRSFPLDPANPIASQIQQTTNFDREEKVFALYGNASWQASNQLTLRAGARLQYTDNEMARSKIGSFFPANFSGSDDAWHLSPTLSTDYAVNDSVYFFARSSIGIKPGGFTAFSDNPGTFSFGDEAAWENEIGVRYESDTNISFELRGYNKQIEDYQLNQIVPNSTDFIIINAEEVRALGLEAEANYQPLDQLFLYATAGWNETTFEEGTTGTLGSQVPFVPDFTASVGFDYDFGNGFFMGASARFVGDTFYDNSENPLFAQSSYNVLDAQFGYQTEDWSLVLYGRNILDEDYYTFVNSQIFAGAPADPGVVGVRYERRF